MEEKENNVVYDVPIGIDEYDVYKRYIIVFLQYAYLVNLENR